MSEPQSEVSQISMSSNSSLSSGYSYSKRVCIQCHRLLRTSTFVGLSSICTKCRNVAISKKPNAIAEQLAAEEKTSQGLREMLEQEQADHAIQLAAMQTVIKANEALETKIHRLEEMLEQEQAKVHELEYQNRELVAGTAFLIQDADREIASLKLTTSHSSLVTPGGSPLSSGFQTPSHTPQQVSFHTEPPS
jgi:hypothetical protein